MSRIAWGAPGQRFFEAGADRGVLYLPNVAGVPWNGLKSVNEAPSGGEPRPYYVDGYKYLNLATAEEFKATLSAFGAPFEFGVCDGTVGIHNGLFATQQPRRPFSLSYRTRIGNEQDQDLGYKIHCVYNALAAPSTRNNETISNSLTPLDLSWSITTTPPKLTGYRPTAHMVIDSRYTPPRLLTQIEDILYGSDTETARLPEIEELVALFNSEPPIIGTNLAWNPEVLSSDGFEEADDNAVMSYDAINQVVRYDFTNAVQGSRLCFNGYVDFEEGVQYRMLVEVQASRLLRVIPQLGGNQSTVRSVYNEWSWINADIVVGPGGTYTFGLQMSPEIPYGAGDWVEIRKLLFSTSDYRGPHFSGATEDTATRTYDWAPGAGPEYGESTVRSWY